MVALLFLLLLLLLGYLTALDAVRGISDDRMRLVEPMDGWMENSGNLDLRTVT